MPGSRRRGEHGGNCDLPRLKETNPLLRKASALHEAYRESENPVVSSLRSVTSTVASWFDENETTRVLQSMNILDPSFSMESFERELREYIMPEVVDAYLALHVS